jgi:hypothetical protein
MRETGGGMVPWNAYDVDPDTLPDIAPISIESGRSVFGMHWPNFFRFNPKRYLDHKNAWVAYLNRQGEYFGAMLSRDIAFAANQELHLTYAKMDIREDGCTIDLSALSSIAFEGMKKTFYVSIEKGRMPRECIGGYISVCEAHKKFNNYKIEYTQDKVEILF